MNATVIRIVVVILAIAFLPLIVNGVAELVVQGIDGATRAIENVFAPFYSSGDARLVGLVKLCLYLVSFTFLWAVLFGRRGGGNNGDQ